MSAGGFGHGGAVGEILDALPLDTTFHVTDCGYDDNDGRCGCGDLPAKLRAIVARHVATALHAAADRIEEAGRSIAAIGPIGDAARNGFIEAAEIVRPSPGQTPSGGDR